MQDIALPLSEDNYHPARVGWCETCHEVYAPPRTWSDWSGISMAVRVWAHRHNRQHHPRRAASGRILAHPPAPRHHGGRTDCR